ncbi:MAG TPA: hypothetical protein PKD10_10370 [Paracoccaceae bacterium]|nr:hypothetical protein [Paracoccaceae bacterium]
MSLARSPLPAPPLRRVLWSAAILWVAPMLPGALCLGTMMLVGGDTGMAIGSVGLALVFAPMVSWIGWALALPPALWLMRRGEFGWMQAALTGAAAGMIAGWIVSGDLAIPVGIVSIVALRGLVSGPMRPDE